MKKVLLFWHGSRITNSVTNQLTRCNKMKKYIVYALILAALANQLLGAAKSTMANRADVIERAVNGWGAAMTIDEIKAAIAASGKMALTAAHDNCPHVAALLKSGEYKISKEWVQRYNNYFIYLAKA